MTNFTQFVDLIDLEIKNSDRRKSEKLIRSFTKLNKDVRLVTEEPSIVDGNLILRISVPRGDKEAWLAAIDNQFSAANVEMDILG